MPRQGFRNRTPWQMLPEAQIDALHEGALRVLAEPGILFEDAWALAFLAQQGCTVDEASGRVRFPRQLVAACLAEAPKQFTLAAPNRANDLHLGGDRLYFTHSSGMQSIDLDTLEPRRPTRQEYIDCIRVLQALPHLDHLGCYPYFGFDDLPDVLAVPAGVALHMQYSDKHQITACSNDAELFTFQMAQALGQEIAGTIGSSPPLTWSSAAVASARRIVEAGYALTTVDGSMMGGTGPATVPGSVIVSTAEHLAMVVLAQCLRPGQRMLIGHFSAPLNMRSGSPAFGQIGSSLNNAMFNQLWRRYGLPLSNGSPGYVNAKGIEFQAGYEKGMAAIAAALSGVNSMLLHLGVANELTAHPVQAILDDDIAGMVGRFISGEEMSEETLAVALIQAVGPIPGHYLNQAHTRKWWRKEQFTGATADTQTYAEWQEGGKKTAFDHARARFASILAAPEQRFTTPTQDAELERILQEARRYFEKRI
ncbi:MAG: trimethylamine methyltransferase family protein [Caldilineales bacterium]|nr:trimethylamine methyltransferase family protein [Caldilineales bacterium]